MLLGSIMVCLSHKISDTLEFPAMRVTGHLEPVSDPRSYEDMAL